MSEDTETPSAPSSEPKPELTLTEQCHALAQGLGALGINVQYGGVFNLADLKPAIDAAAAGAMLIQKGICTREEWDEVSLTMLREVLAATLQQVEIARAQSTRPQLALPHRDAPTPSEERVLRALRSPRQGAGSMHNVGRYKD